MNVSIYIKLLFGVTLMILVVSSCTLKSVKHTFKELTPYEKYMKDLEAANLHGRPMVKQWIAEGERAMRDSVRVTLPLSETGSFLSHEPEARSYKFEARDGQVLTLKGATSSTGNAKLFVDLFLWKDDQWKVQASADSILELTYEFERDAKCLIRIQPELLVNAYYSLQLQLTPVLINPVKGASNKSIQSFYGDQRDGGKRSHEGIDIFAKKGTPVVAPTSGVVSRVGYSRLGGKVVWMHDKKRGHSYYFAHLDSQYVQTGQNVNQGDVLGVVGNTGNARFTPPHLHFGIYQSRSKDPLYYVKTLEALTEKTVLDTSFRVAAFKTVAKTSPLLSGPNASSKEILMLDRNHFVRVVAQSRDWYRVSLPDKIEGYVLKKDIAPVRSGDPVKLKETAQVRTGISPYAPVIDELTNDTTIELLASFKEHRYIKTSDGLFGWVTLNTL